MRDIRFECIVRNVEFKRYNFCTNEKKTVYAEEMNVQKDKFWAGQNGKKSKICLYPTTSQW